MCQINVGQASDDAGPTLIWHTGADGRAVQGNKPLPHCSGSAGAVLQNRRARTGPRGHNKAFGAAFITSFSFIDARQKVALPASAPRGPLKSRFVPAWQLHGEVKFPTQHRQLSNSPNDESRSVKRGSTVRYVRGEGIWGKSFLQGNYRGHWTQFLTGHCVGTCGCPRSNHPIFT